MTPHLVIEVARRMAAKQDKATGTHQVSNHVEDIQWHEKYAGKHDPVKGIVVGNWNNPDVYDAETKMRRDISDIPERLCRIFEKMGLEVEWSDMVSTCDDCGGVVETAPSHAWWTPPYVSVNDCEILCLDCCKPEDRFDDFTKGYVECALWSSNDESDEQGGEPLDRNYSVSDISKETAEKMIADCKAFQDDNRYALEATYGKGKNPRSLDAHAAGHDFWLNRNGHGAGFWDGDWPEPHATALDKASKVFGEVNLYVGDDGQIHGT